MLKLQDLSKFLLWDFITGQATKVRALRGKKKYWKGEVKQLWRRRHVIVIPISIC